MTTSTKLQKPARITGGVDYGLGVATAALQYDSIIAGVSAPVPEIDPSSFGSAFALLIGSLGWMERHARRGFGLITAARSPA